MPHGFIYFSLLMKYDYMTYSKIAMSPVSFDVVVSIFKVPYNSMVDERRMFVWIPQDKFEEIGEKEILQRVYSKFWSFLAEDKPDMWKLISVKDIIPELDDNIEHVMKCQKMLAEAASESDEDDESEASETSDDQTTEHKEV